MAESDEAGTDDGVRVGVVRFGAAWSRRRRHSSDPRQHKITVRLNAEELATVSANAAAARLSIGSYLAELGTAPLVPGKNPGGLGAERAEALIELMGVHRQLVGAARNLNQAVAALHALGEEPGQLRVVAEYVRGVASRVDEAVAKVAGSR